ncbi:hypothetical protein SAMN05216480_110122 [Pustulibacterium marinum]|uniref:Uncharacterized protein n=1 Tax=Pustulibacterium marinum TaxID=1224947 RepID=A0A1I7HQ15_9FLAO|nr:hypothetical protein [Pustulibacterium marinum]SFU62812.1 hypothetical protein SAMN05216480_110122 [Pustulibacterium marinum]
MRIEDHHIIEEVLEIHQLEFGDFFFFDDFVVGQIHEEELFNWSKASVVIKLAEKLYGTGCMPHYISNRIYDYSIIAQDWLTFFQNRYVLKSYIIVTYKDSSVMNMMFEKLFLKETIITKCKSLDDALSIVK